MMMMIEHRCNAIRIESKKSIWRRKRNNVHTPTDIITVLIVQERWGSRCCQQIRYQFIHLRFGNLVVFRIITAALPDTSSAIYCKIVSDIPTWSMLPRSECIRTPSIENPRLDGSMVINF